MHSGWYRNGNRVSYYPQQAARNYLVSHSIIYREVTSMPKQHSTLALSAILAISLFSGKVLAQDAGEATDTAASAPATSMESASSEHVARALFTSEVQNREPTDTITSLSNDKNKIYFFSELTGLRRTNGDPSLGISRQDHGRNQIQCGRPALAGMVKQNIAASMDGRMAGFDHRWFRQ